MAELFGDTAPAPERDDRRRPTRRSPSACGRARSAEFVGQEHLVGPGKILERALRGRARARA